jgi:tetratricopeptide (TPR) repeat protein
MDPLFVPGYNGLAEIYILGSFFGKVPPNMGYPKAKEYAEKALEIDNNFSDAYRILGAVQMYYNWDWEAAEDHLEHAIRLNPNSEWGHHSYSRFLSLTGHGAEAIAEAKRAIELDPLSGYYRGMLGFIYVYAGQFEQAIHYLRRTIAKFPDYYMGHWGLGIAYQCTSMMDEAIEEYRMAIELSGEIPMIVTFLACALYIRGEIEETERLMNRVEMRSRKEYIPATCFFPYYLLRGDQDQAFSWVERAIQERDVWLPLNIYIPIKEYRMPNEPRFSRIMEQIGLQQFFQDETT